MDALKKAEEAKRQSEAAATERVEPQEPGIASEAAPEAAAEAAGAEPRGLPELPARLELLDAEFHTGAKPAPAAARPRQATEAAQQKERAAAQNLFEAKQPPQRKAFPLFIGLFVLVAAAGIGAWFWWQLQPAGGLGIAPGAARPSPIAARPQPAATVQAPPAPVAQQPAAAPEPAPAAQPPLAEAPPVAAAAERSARPAARPAAEAAQEPASPIRITTGKLKLNPTIDRAYQALMAGDLATAQRDYEQVLKAEPKNIDALQGLAAISIQQGRPDAAERFYVRILEADPRDASAQAGLIGLRGQGDQAQSESRLKSLLAAQPDSPSLNFALGNHYARLGRWNDAQQAYFRAYNGDSDNPDYLFNLAISLEQLRQPRLALQYYQGALATAAHRPAAFDKDQAAGRIRELQK
jgi:tetratricopeptide (TPR) repeat protein